MHLGAHAAPPVIWARRSAAVAIAAAPTIKRVGQELGGKSANIVFDDADLSRAVRGSASVWTFHSGQICIAPTRLYVQAGVYDEFVERLTKNVSE